MSDNMELQPTSCKDCLQLRSQLIEIQAQRDSALDELAKFKTDFTALSIKAATLERMVHRMLVTPNLASASHSVAVETSVPKQSKKKIQTEWNKADFAIQAGSQSVISEAQTEIINTAEASCQNEIVFSTVGTQALTESLSRSVQVYPSLETANTQTAVMESKKKCQTDLSSFNTKTTGVQTKSKVTSKESGVQTISNRLKVARGFNWWVTGVSNSVKEASIQEDGKGFINTADKSEHAIPKLLDQESQYSPESSSISCQFEISYSDSFTQTSVLSSDLSSIQEKPSFNSKKIDSAFYDKQHDIHEDFEELSSDLSKPGKVSGTSSVNNSSMISDSKSIESSQSDFEYIPIFSEYRIPKITKFCRSSLVNREHELRSIPIDSMRPFDKLTSIFKKSNPDEPPPKKIHLGDSGGMRYDKEKKRWIIEGADMPDDAPVKPPPKFVQPVTTTPSQGPGAGRSRYVDIMGAQEFSQDYKPVTKNIDLDEDLTTPVKKGKEVITFTEEYRQDSDHEQIYTEERYDILEPLGDHKDEPVLEPLETIDIVENTKSIEKESPKEAVSEKYEKMLQAEKEKLEEVRKEYSDFTKRTEEEMEEIKLEKEELEETVKLLNEAKAKAEIKIQELEWELRIESEDKAALQEELKTFELRAIELEKQAIKSRMSDCSTVISESEGCDLQLKTIQLENEILILKSQIAQKEFTISEYKENFNDMQTQRNLLSKQLERLKHDQEVMVGYYQEERQRLQQALSTTRQQLTNTKEKYRHAVDELENVKGLLEENEMRVSILSQSKSKMDVEYKKELFDKKQRVQELQAEVLELSTALEHEKVERLEIEKANTTTEHRCMALQSQVAQLNTQVDELYDKNYKLQQEVNERSIEMKGKYEQEFGVARAQIVALQQRSFSLEEQLAHKGKELEDAKIAVVQNQKELAQKMMESRKKYEEEMEKFRGKNKNLNEELSSLKEMYQQQFKQVQDESEEKYLGNDRKLKDEIYNLEKDKQEATEKLEESERSLNTLQAKINELEHTIDQLHQTHKNTIQQSQNKQSQVQKELTEAHKTIQQLEEVSNQLKNQAAYKEKELTVETENLKNDLIDFSLRYKTLENETDKIINDLKTDLDENQYLIKQLKQNYAALESQASQETSALEQQLSSNLTELETLKKKSHEVMLEKKTLVDKYEIKLSELKSQLDDKELILDQQKEAHIFLEHQLQQKSSELEKLRYHHDVNSSEAQTQLKDLRLAYEHDMTTLNLKINKLEDAVSNLETEKKLLESKLRRQNERILELTAVEENSLDLENQIDELNSRIQQLESYNQILENQLNTQAKENSKQLEKEIQALKLKNTELEREFKSAIEKYEQAEERHQESNRQVDELYEKNLEIQQSIALKIAEEKQKWESEMKKRLSEEGDRANFSALKLKEQRIKWELDMINKFAEEKSKWEADAEQNLKEARKRWEAEQRPKTSDSSESLMKLLKKKDEELSVLRQEFQTFLEKCSESPIAQEPDTLEVTTSIKEAVSVPSPPQSEPEVLEVEQSGWISSFLGTIFLTDRERGVKS
jgi:chromosome segregation ATPase